MEKPGTVYFSPIKDSIRPPSGLEKVKLLAKKAGMRQSYKKDDLVAVKVHFGEFGNTAYLRPVFLHPLLRMIVKAGAKPFLTDTNTLYVGMRTNAVDHLHNVSLNGFGYSTFGVPAIIADGLKGESFEKIPVKNGVKLKQALVGKTIVDCDAMIVVSHFKGHKLFGFGGAVKNIAMGCAARPGKMIIHSDSRPGINSQRCSGCGKCISGCQVKAITTREKYANLDPEKCVGCTRCIGICPAGAVEINRDKASEQVISKAVEYASAIHNHFHNKIFYINFMTNISPDCDCIDRNGPPVCPDIGYVAGKNPFDVDNACYNLLVERCGEDPFIKHAPYCKTEFNFSHAQKINAFSGSVEIKLA